MRDNSQVLAATVVGAVVGAAAGYLFFTNHGRSLRRQIEPAIEDFARELSQFRGTFNRAAGMAAEGWKLLNEALAEDAPRAPHYPSSRQTAPF